MSTQVALLRGINVGGNNMVPMADLRAIFESLGCADVVTYIQSGNVVFARDTEVVPQEVEDALEERIGVRIVVVLRSAAALQRVVAGVPFADADVTKLHVGFMAHDPDPDRVANLETERFLPEQFAVVGRELYLYLPVGMGQTKLPAYLDRQLKVPITVRNWNTVNKLVELCRS